MKKLINGMSFGKIKLRLNGFGVHLTDDEFNSLNYRELRAIFRKAEKIDRLQNEIQQIVEKPKRTPIVKKVVDK